MIDIAPLAVPPRKGAADLSGTARPNAPPLRPAPPRRSALGALVLLGFVATAAGGAWLWQQQQEIVAGVQPPGATQDQSGALAQRVTQLEQRPAPVAAASLEGRFAGLEQRLAQLEQRPAPAPVAPLQDQLGTLEKRLDLLEQRPAPAPVLLAGTAAETPPDAVTFLAGRLQTLEQRVARAEQEIIASTARAGRLQAARSALEAGRPLGEIQGAPAALARFATTSPPTEASLRLSFPAAASAAAQASDPANGGLPLPLAQRMWQQVQTLATIRQGDKVLVGVPAARVLADAQVRLDVGDLAGAVAALDQLDPAAASSIAGWRQQAQALLDARAALTDLAHS